MFGLETKLITNLKAIEDAKKKAGFKNFAHAAARIRKDMAQSMVKSDEPAAPGEPPHTRGRGGHNLPGSIRFDATAVDAVIGPRASVVDDVGFYLETGERRGETDLEEHPFAVPALERNDDRFASDWAGSFGG